MTSYTISRWQQRWLNATSGFVFDDVTLFWRPTSIHKPNFIDISQSRAENDLQPGCEGHAIIWHKSDYFRNGTRLQRHSYNGILIGTHVRTTQRVISYNLEWLSRIFNDTTQRAASLRQLSLLLSVWAVVETQELRLNMSCTIEMKCDNWDVIRPVLNVWLSSFLSRCGRMSFIERRVRSHVQ